MDSTGLHASLAQIFPQLDRAIRLFHIHPGHVIPIHNALEFSSDLRGAIEDFDLPQTQRLAACAEELLSALAGEPEHTTSQSLAVVLSTLHELREVLVSAQATGSEIHETPQTLFDSLEQMTRQLSQDVLPFAASDRPAALTEDELERIQETWAQLAEQADRFSIAFFERFASSAFRRILPDNIDEDLQRQFIQAVAIGVRFAGSPEQLASFGQQIAVRSGLDRLPRYELQALSEMFLNSIENLIDDAVGNDEPDGLIAWKRLLEIFESNCLVAQSESRELRKAG